MSHLLVKCPYWPAAMLGTAYLNLEIVRSLAIAGWLRRVIYLISHGAFIGQFLKGLQLLSLALQRRPATVVNAQTQEGSPQGHALRKGVAGHQVQQVIHGAFGPQGRAIHKTKKHTF